MPDCDINAEVITHGLTTAFVGRRVLYFDTLESTMDVARMEALQGAPEGTAVLAEQQTAGRGRLKRLWLTPGGNIAVSIILRPPAECRNSLIMLASLSVLHAIQAETGLDCTLKWPNDVQIGGKKVAGILIETKTGLSSLDYAILGIGINVNMQMMNYPEIRDIATSLSDCTGQTVSRTSLLRHLFVAMENLYQDMKAGKPLYPEWKKSLHTIGKKVIVRSPNRNLEGIAESVREDGCLLLRCEDGTIEQVTIGDISLREQKQDG